MTELLSRNLRAVRERVERACRRAGRRPEEVTLVAVTKTVPPEVAAGLARLGARELGENRLERLAEKAASRGLEDVRWHFVGHLQRNKARKVARLAEVVHSVDTLELIDTLGRVCAEEGLRRALFLQVKLSAEKTKHGLDPSELPAALERVAAQPSLSLLGLMTMAPLVRRPGRDGAAADPADAAGRAAARAVFARLAALARELPPAAFAGGSPRLSMGMSGDLEEAVEEGAHFVRVGSALFRGLPSKGALGSAP